MFEVVEVEIKNHKAPAPAASTPGPGQPTTPRSALPPLPYTPLTAPLGPSTSAVAPSPAGTPARRRVPKLSLKCPDGEDALATAVRKWYKRLLVHFEEDVSAAK
jgi:hypothetical protein